MTSVYKITSNFPEQEKFGLRLQMRKAIISVSSNAAEGSGRVSKAGHVIFIAQHAEV